MHFMWGEAGVEGGKEQTRETEKEEKGGVGWLLTFFLN